MNKKEMSISQHNQTPTSALLFHLIYVDMILRLCAASTTPLIVDIQQFSTLVEWLIHCMHVVSIVVCHSLLQTYEHVYGCIAHFRNAGHILCGYAVCLIFFPRKKRTSSIILDSFCKISSI